MSQTSLPEDSQETTEVEKVSAYTTVKLSDGWIPLTPDILKKLGWTEATEVELFVIDGSQLIVRDRGFGNDSIKPARQAKGSTKR